MSAPAVSSFAEEMRVFCLGSGSTGNLFVLEAEGARVVVEAGMNPTRASGRMRALGADLFGSAAARPLGIVVTHQHGDHFAQAEPLARALGAPLYLHAGTEAKGLRHRAATSSGRKAFDVKGYEPGKVLELGPFTVEALVIPHDAAQVALRVRAGGQTFGLATDLGHAPRALEAWLGACDLAFVEANHCPRMLEEGPYPFHLRRRVAGPVGHLSNADTAALAERLAATRLARLVLCHLSRANNTPARALEVVASRSRGLPVEVLPHGVARAFDTNRLTASGEPAGDRENPPSGVHLRPAPRHAQLELAFAEGGQ